MMPGDGDGIDSVGMVNTMLWNLEMSFFLVEVIKKTLKSFVL